MRKNGQSRYVLGLAAATIAEGFRRQLAPPEELAPRIRAVVAATGETSYASGWVDGRIAVLATGQSPVQAAEVPHGYSGHVHARATGKLLLALSFQAMRDEYLAANPLAGLTKRTTTSREDLLKEFELIARQGYAVDNEEFTEGLCCLAVPVEGLGSCLRLASPCRASASAPILSIIWQGYAKAPASAWSDERQRPIARAQGDRPWRNWMADWHW